MISSYWSTQQLHQTARGVTTKLKQQRPLQLITKGSYTVTCRNIFTIQTLDEEASRSSMLLYLQLNFPFLPVYTITPWRSRHLILFELNLIPTAFH